MRKASSTPSLGNGRIGKQLFQVADLRVLVLLHAQPMSGYELRKKMLNSFKFNMSYGTLYPHLRTLESSKLITGRWRRSELNKTNKKRTYTLTSKGKNILRTNIDNLSTMVSRMHQMLSRRVRSRIPS